MKCGIDGSEKEHAQQNDASHLSENPLNKLNGYDEGYKQDQAKLNHHKLRKKRRVTILVKDHLKDKIEWVFQKISDNPKAKDLLLQVSKKYKNFSIEFLSLKEDKGLEHGGTCCVQSKRIRILESLDKTRTLATVIFELCNAMNDDLNNQNILNFLDIPNGQDLYAITTEIDEFRSFSAAKEIYTHGILHFGYPAPTYLKTLSSYISERTLSYALSFLPKPLAWMCGALYLDKDLSTNLALLDKKPYIFWGNSHTDAYRKQWKDAKENQNKIDKCKKRKPENTELGDTKLKKQKYDEDCKTLPHFPHSLTM